MRFLYALLLFTASIFGQQNIQLSKQAEISILTCAPGQNELYSYFGHSAIRVKDSSNKLDRVYNYGMFDFNTPNFYLKFCRGQLLYQVSSYEYKYFPYIYYVENRWIKAQTLNLSPAENQKMFDYLEWNTLPENKDYHYDFFFDNCATKIQEVIEKSIGKIDFDYTDFPKDLTHRNLIHSYLPKNSWAKFGIDLALGAIIDQKVSLKEYMFLPGYVYQGIKNSTLNDKKLILKETNILPDHKLIKPITNFFISPLLFCLLLLIITYYLRITNRQTKKWFNALSLSYGVVGIILLSLWFLTEHSATKINMNILWANPLLLAFPFIKNTWKKRLSYINLGMLFLFLTLAITEFQEFNICFYLLAITIVPLYLKSLLTFKI